MGEKWFGKKSRVQEFLGLCTFFKLGMESWGYSNLVYRYSVQYRDWSP